MFIFSLNTFSTLKLQKIMSLIGDVVPMIWVIFYIIVLQTDYG